MSWKNSLPDAELYTYDYFFLDYVCRLCWCADGVVELSSFNPKSLKNDVTIGEKIQECIGIDVSTHIHPRKVCSKCLDEVEIFTDFRRFCQETDRKLHNILENGTSQHKEQSIESGDELIILKEEPHMEFSNLELVDSIDDLFDDLPLSCEIRSKDRPVKQERRKRSPHYCNSCHLNLKSAENLTEHNLECHGIEENGLYKCFGCDKKFKSIKKRLRHESDTCKSLKSGYKCSICDRFLPKRRAYEHHMRAHRENKEINFADEYKCNKCKESFVSIECLKEHMVNHFQKDKKSYICDACGRVFLRRDYLNKHKLTHSGSRQLKCPHCDYSALQKSTLNVHIRKHTGERPYPCDLCPQRCVTSSNLRDHRKRHFGIKAFECRLCDKKFGYKLSLEEHMATTHERSESHACSHCGVTYNRFRSLRHHLLAKHGKKIRKSKNDVVEVPKEQKKVNNQVVLDNRQVTLQNIQVTGQNSQSSGHNNQNVHIIVQNTQVDDPVENNQVAVKNSQLTGQNSQNVHIIVQNAQVSEQNSSINVLRSTESVLILNSEISFQDSQVSDQNNQIDVLNSQLIAQNSQNVQSESKLVNMTFELRSVENDEVVKNEMK